MAERESRSCHFNSSSLTTLMLNRKTYTVGIVGAGMAGMYAVHPLQVKRLDPGTKIQVHLYELNGQVGGRVHTHRFTSEKDQYYEAGAMRIPQTKMHEPVNKLIEYLNQCGADLKPIDYKLSYPGNLLFVNGCRTAVGVRAVGQSARELGFEVPPEYQDRTANELLFHEIEGFINF